MSRIPVKQSGLVSLSFSLSFSLSLYVSRSHFFCSSLFQHDAYKQTRPTPNPNWLSGRTGPRLSVQFEWVPLTRYRSLDYKSSQTTKRKDHGYNAVKEMIIMFLLLLILTTTTSTTTITDVFIYKYI